MTGLESEAAKLDEESVIVLRQHTRTKAEMGQLLEAATHEEREQLLHHYVEVIELHTYDAKGKKGTYAMRLFPEVRPDRNFEWQEVVPIIGSIDAGSDTQKVGQKRKTELPTMMTTTPIR